MTVKNRNMNENSNQERIYAKILCENLHQFQLVFRELLHILYHMHFIHLQVKADLNFQPLSPKKLFYICSRFVIGPNRSFDDRSHRVSPDDFPKILIENLE